MKIPKQARQTAKQFFRLCLVEGQLDETRVRQTVNRIAEIKPRGYLPILSFFQHLVKLEVDRRTARVDSALALEPSLQNQIRDRLIKRCGAGLQFEFVVAPALIGGLRVKVGSDVYDGSVLARLNLLRSQF
jgi:F-type H+-transporting ATPase subunit delta